MEKDNVKFACLCLRTWKGNSLSQVAADLGDGFHVENPWEELDLDVWKEGVGTWRLSEITDSVLWIWVTAPSARLDVSDSENDALEARLACFWQALQLHRTPIIHSAWIVSGTLRSARPQVTSFQDRPRLFIKEPGRELELPQLQQVARTAKHLEDTYASVFLTGRIDRGLTAFFSAMKSPHIDDSLLSLQRSLEGVVHPNNRSQFVSRLASVIALLGNQRADTERLLDEIYQVRSGFTHAMAIASIFPSRTPADALHRAQQLQAAVYLISAGCYREILGNPSLLQQFAIEGIGPYWGDVVTGRQPLPFTVALDPNDWAFPAGALDPDA